MLEPHSPRVLIKLTPENLNPRLPTPLLILQRSKALLEEQVRQLREKLEDTEALLARARDEAETAQASTKSAEREVERMRQKLQVCVP